MIMIPDFPQRLEESGLTNFCDHVILGLQRLPLADSIEQILHDVGIPLTIKQVEERLCRRGINPPAFQVESKLERLCRCGRATRLSCASFEARTKEI
jgi:hypothetical protein